MVIVAHGLAEAIENNQNGTLWSLGDRLPSLRTPILESPRDLANSHNLGYPQSNQSGGNGASGICSVIPSPNMSLASRRSWNVSQATNFRLFAT
jgi:hypothetical protein